MIAEILIGVIVVAVLYKLYEDKKGSSGGKGSASAILGYTGKGYMSVLADNNKLYGGSYNLHGQQTLKTTQGSYSIPANESIYQIVKDGNRLLLACEMSGGKLYSLMNGKTEVLWSGGLDDVISAGRFNGQLCAVSTSYNNGGIKFHNITKGIHKTLAGGKFHARQIIQYGNFFYILAFDYSKNVGGWFISSDLINWSWRGTMPKERSLKAVVHKGKMYIATSPYNGSRVPPAKIKVWDGRALKDHFVSTSGHAMFFGIASDGQNLYYGTLTNWGGGGNAILYKNKKPIWTCPEPEITDISCSDGNVYVATRNAHRSGRIYRITGEPGYTEPAKQPAKPATSIGGGFRYKPISEGDHNLVILFPASWPTPGVVKMNGEVGRFAERTNGNRPTFRFSKPGKNYKSPGIIEVDGVRYSVPNTAQDIR